MEKRKNKKKSTLVLLLLLLVGISIGYAALTSNLNIHGNTKIKKAEWDVHFENLVKSEGSESADKEAVIDASKTLIEYTVKLPEPGDFYEFTVDIVNKGSIDAMVSEVLKTGLNADQEKYIEYTAAYTRGVEVGEKDILKAGKRKNIKVRVKYKDDLNPEDLPTEDKPIDLSFQVTYVQADETAKALTPSIMRSYKFDSTDDYHSDEYKSKVTKIDFKVDEEIPTTAIDSWDVSQDQDKSVMAYIEDDKTGNGTYKVTIVGDGNVTANEDSSYLFNNFSNLKEVDINVLNTSNVTNMSYMFCDCSSLTSLDLSNKDLSNVLYMNHMFRGCSSLTNMNLSNTDLSSISDMTFMFASCKSLTSVDLSNTNLSNVLYMNSMFRACSSLTNLDLSNTNLISVAYMSNMFRGCSSLTTTITIKRRYFIWDWMFEGAATNDGAQITVNYTNEASSLVDQMIATKSENSNVVKGELVSN